MSGFYGDLVVPDISPFEAAAHYTVEELRAALEGLSEVAANLGFANIWSQTSLVGADRGPEPPGPARGVLGVSLAWACIAGVGFWRDYFLEPAVPEVVRRMLTQENAQERGLGQHLLAKAEREALTRGLEAEVIQRIAEAAIKPFRWSSALNIQATWAYEFEVAYRRRLAYALACEASIVAGSLAPYHERLQVLILGQLDDLMATCPAVDDAQAFSVYLNLLAVLNMAVAYEQRYGKPHTALPGVLHYREPKQVTLRLQLAEAAEKQRTRLGFDGQIAVQALLVEVELLHQQLYNGVLPLWGQIAPSTNYRSYLTGAIEKPS